MLVCQDFFHFSLANRTGDPNDPCGIFDVSPIKLVSTARWLKQDVEVQLVFRTVCDMSLAIPASFVVLMWAALAHAWLNGCAANESSVFLQTQSTLPKAKGDTDAKSLGTLHRCPLFGFGRGLLEDGKGGGDTAVAIGPYRAPLYYMLDTTETTTTSASTSTTSTSTACSRVAERRNGTLPSGETETTFMFPSPAFEGAGAPKGAIVDFEKPALISDPWRPGLAISSDISSDFCCRVRSWDLDRESPVCAQLARTGFLGRPGFQLVRLEDLRVKWPVTSTLQTCQTREKSAAQWRWRWGNSHPEWGIWCRNIRDLARETCRRGVHLSEASWL